jgi:hypothetical protein
MSNNSNTFRLGNEQLLLINILNSMYNDNLRQITNLNETLNNLNNTNNQIRNSLIQILNNPYINQANNSRRNGFSDRRGRENNNNDRNNNDRNNNYNRLFLNNRPYIIDSITEYTFPRVTSRNNDINQVDTSGLLNNFFTNFMQPVEVYPTQSQIEAATRRVQYCNITRPINNQCPISMDDFNDNDMVTVIRHCGHIFQTEHLMNWFRTNCRCPVCRYDIRDYNSNASTEFFSDRSEITSELIQNQTQRTGNFDSSNNNIERNTINRTDSMNSFGSNTNHMFNDMFNDAFIENLVGTTDLSGNRLDNMLGGTAALFYILNSMNNRARNFR